MKLKNILMMSLLISSSYLWAHTALDNSIPENGAIINEAPNQIILSFTQPANLVKFELLSPENVAIDTAFKPALKVQSEFVIEIDKSLTAGLHTVFWTLVGSDGHKVEGDLQFTVKEI